MLSSRQSAAVALLALSISGTAPDSLLVSGWVGPSVAGRTGRGVVRARPTAAAAGDGLRAPAPAGAADSSSGRSSCRCGTATSMIISGSSGREDTGRKIEECGKRLIMMPGRSGRSPPARRRRDEPGGGPDAWSGVMDGLKRAGVGALAGLFLMAGAGGGAAFADVGGLEPTSSVTVQDLQRYDGFEDYAAQGQQMENSDVGCFANECKRETASCFTDGSCLKGVTCLGRCKGEQECATRCFAQYGSGKLDSWLTCTLEDHSCVKIPKDMDFSVIDKDPPHIVRGFQAKQLQGTWYKVMGVNKKYDCFDCQKNTFSVTQRGEQEDGEGGESTTGEVADIKVNFRLAKPDSDDFWENTITERLQVDPVGSPRTFHTDGKLFGLSFKENWYVTGHSTDPGEEFVFVQYKGHTLQGSYDGGFVYARKPTLPSTALAKVAKVARDHGIDPDSMVAIDNTCSIRKSLPRAGDTTRMNPLERLQYEASFVYDLMEWVHPGTIHKYAKADQKNLNSPTATTTTFANAGGRSSSLKAGSPLGEDEG
nr:violaxanthin deepoxidase like protein [synthetic construct]|eukprot:g17820.t1